MYLVDFIYDGLKLSNFGCMVGNAVTSSDNAISMGSVVQLETAVNHGTYTSEIINADYPDVYTVTFDIFKKNCGGGYDGVFEDKEVTWFMRWLNRKDYHKFIPIYDNPKDFYRLFFMGTFTECKAITMQGHVYGFSLTFTSNSPFAYLDYKPNTFNITELNQSIVIDGSSIGCGSFSFYDTSEELGAVYPTSFVVKLKQSGDLIILNNMDSNGRYTQVKNCSSGEILTFDCIHKIITSSGHPTQRLYNDFNYVFPRLMNTFDNSLNVFYVSRKCEITINYNPIRKVGVIA